MRWQITIIASLALAACETNEATDLVEVTAADLAGTYDLALVGGEQTNSLDPEFCLASTLTLDADGSFVILHQFDERVAFGIDQACRTDADRTQVDVEWRGSFSNTSTLVVMQMEETETTLTIGDTSVSEVSADNTELVGEFAPESERLIMTFPEIWGFNPHGGSGGKISVGGGARGLGGGVLVFDR